MSNSAWRIEAETATLIAHDARLRLDNPAAGLQISAASLFGVYPAGATLELSEAYTRGDDLVARYQPTDAFPFRTEIYWRVVNPGDPSELGLALILSVETDLLDTQPALVVASRFPAARVTPLASDGVGTEPRLQPADPLSAIGALTTGWPIDGAWFEGVHPSDAQEAQLEIRAGDPRVVESRWRLFATFLEKGVIRRARLAGAALDGEDLAQAASRYAQFAAESPPLTV